MAVEAAAQAVVDARAAHPGSTLADLYDPLAMPPTLRAAHRTLDARVERLYRAKKFSYDTERVQHLFRVLRAAQCAAGAGRSGGAVARPGGVVSKDQQGPPNGLPHPPAPSPPERGSRESIKSGELRGGSV